ncbi:hypothetical protein G7047_18250 [Diaphorobacter sp. HDW4A]|uniref:hypothetical protein n=1 Tax=Diaphorobacter sp. HDW4A TaxID=2714924 RepID=UPI00140CC492|nr:hypothetical protein [Diaphorobacter sp. HDW4A]QIL81637.1 hypothetical protein G7047_18250 [Diaphorobacter sp. HDW4A]
MTLLFPRSIWIRALWIALIFTVCAVSVRLFWGYPRCQNDELNWVQIARNIDAGRDWPVSGPFFMFVLRELKSLTAMGYVQLISGLGVFSVFVGTLLIILGYSRLRITRPGITLAALALSSYFWVPLLEARPQQWGQILVFIGTIAAWLWLHRRGGWLIFPVLVLISFSHILSHAILVFVCTALTLADYFENRPLTKRHAILLACSLLSLVVYILPNGPYQTMLRDIEQNHLHRLLVAAPWLAAGMILAILGIMLFKPRLHWRAHWSRHTMEYALTHQKIICAGLLVVFFIAMSVQASVLPSASWLPYGGSIWIFVVFQTGNLVFASLFVLGLFAFFRATSHQEIETFHARLITWTLLSFGVLGLLTLIGSFWMRDTNWLLRLINYAILFAAPIAAMGLGSIRLLKKHPTLYILLAPLFVVSICQAVRPDGYLGC